MSRGWILAWIAGVSMGLGMLSMSSVARADGLPAASSSAETTATPPAPPAASPTGGGCPYSRAYQSGHHCCCGGGGLRYGVAAVSVLTVGAGVLLHVLSLNRGADVTRMYDARDPNHSEPLSSYPDLMQMDGQRQAMQNWAVGLYIGGGILTAMSAMAFIAPMRWRNRVPRYAPAVAVGPTSASLTFQF